MRLAFRYNELYSSQQLIYGIMLLVSRHFVCVLVRPRVLSAQ